MSLKDVQEGKYRAVIKEGAWLKPQGKSPSVGIQFQFEAEKGKMETIEHHLYTSEKARPYTMDKLVEMGYDFDRVLKQLDGFSVFDSSYFTEKAFDIVLGNESYTDSNGNERTSLKVKYINLLGGSAMAGTSVQAALGNIDMHAEIEAAKARLASKGRLAPKGATANVNEEIPF